MTVIGLSDMPARTLDSGTGEPLYSMDDRAATITLNRSSDTGGAGSRWGKSTPGIRSRAGPDPASRAIPAMPVLWPWPPDRRFAPSGVTGTGAEPKARPCKAALAKFSLTFSFNSIIIEIWK
ncbi:MAG: hypothetical protein OYG32_01325, partial [Rhodospirillaceae bacterium]|nr:hypothetical protein [Rhodospirillaceae bacterium]